MNFFNNNKQNKKPYIKLSKLEVVTFSILIAIHIIFTAFTIYLLNTPINDWVLNLGQYNAQLLELFPKAQNWVNNSPAFREKLILIYAMYQPKLWFMLVVMIVVMLVQYKRYTNPEIISIGSYCHNLKKLIFGVFFFGIMIYGVFTFMNVGSEVYKLYDDLDRTGIINEFRKYNTITGFAIHVYIFKVAGVYFITWILFVLIYQLIYCLKQRRDK